VVAPDVVEDGMRFYLERSKGEPMKHAHDIACLLTAIATHYVEVEPATLKRLRFIRGRMKPKQRGMTVKNKELLRQFDDSANVRKLLNLPERIFESLRGRAPNRKDALKAQSALAVQILLMIPMRLGNLCALELDRHIIRPRPGCAYVAISGHEVKNDRDIDAALPEVVARMIDTYVAKYRPLLMREESLWLFPGEKEGRPKARVTLWAQITTFIARECGLKMNPHLFRHFAAKLYLTENPGAYGVVQQVLNHKSVETTRLFYCGTETAAALKSWEDLVTGYKTDVSSPRKTSDRRPMRKVA
jgi:integrase